MRKNCVQPVSMLCIFLCKTYACTQNLFAMVVRMCKNLNQFTHLPQLIHSCLLSIYSCCLAGFSHFSTKPIITTIFIYNKEQLRVVGGIHG